MSELDKLILNGTTYDFAGSSGEGGQPKPITLASQMTDTDIMYLYLGNETGYTYGYIYAYVGSAWTKTTLYGKGFSPSASVEKTSTGAKISITDENGTTTANVTNGSATDAQVQTYVNAWLNAHPEATTTVEDGSITEAKLAEDVASAISEANGYKVADKSTWILPFTDSTEGITILEHTRAHHSYGEQTISDCTTYLIPNSLIQDKGAFVKIEGSTYWQGFYTQTDSGRTYTFTQYYLYANESYTGVAVCLSGNKRIDTLKFLNSISVITKKTSPLDIPGFSGFEGGTVQFEKGSNSYLAKLSIPVENNKVYAIRLGQYSTIRPWAVRNWMTSFTAESNARYCIMGEYYIMASIDGYLTFQCELSTIGSALYNSDGLEVYILDKPWEVQAKADTLPTKPLIHAGNHAHIVLLAYAMGWKGIEADTATTSDGVIVLSHDATVGGLTIADSTYSALKAAFPPLMTVDDIIAVSKYFGNTIDFDFHHGRTSADDKWKALRKGIQAGIDHIGYYTGDGGNIGPYENINTFYETGVCYGYGDGNDIPSSVFAACHYIGTSGGNVEDNPQIAYCLKGAATSGGISSNQWIHDNYSDYLSLIAYFNNNYQIYDAECLGINLSSNSLTFTASGTKRLTPSVTPIYCSKPIAWTTSDSSVATVTPNSSATTLHTYATVTAVGNGTCTITATCGGFSAECTVTVSGL